MNSTLYNEFKFFRSTSLFKLLVCIFVIKVQYFTYTSFVKGSIEIQQVLTFQNNLLPLVLMGKFILVQV
jgi:hypothetical protein